MKIPEKVIYNVTEGDTEVVDNGKGRRKFLIN